MTFVEDERLTFLTNEREATLKKFLERLNEASAGRMRSLKTTFEAEHDWSIEIRQLEIDGEDRYGGERTQFPEFADRIFMGGPGQFVEIPVLYLKISEALSWLSGLQQAAGHVPDSEIEAGHERIKALCVEIVKALNGSDVLRRKYRKEVKQHRKEYP